jgi:four helix bundle protein
MRYKDLIVWQKSHALTLKTLNALKKVPRSFEGDIIVKQLIRAVTSIGANIAEGYGRHEGKEYLHFLEFAYGSSNEVDNWFNVLKDAGLMQSELAQELINDNEEILKILATIIKKLKGNGAGSTPYSLRPTP